MTAYMPGQRVVYSTTSSGEVKGRVVEVLSNGYVRWTVTSKAHSHYPIGTLVVSEPDNPYLKPRS